MAAHGSLEQRFWAKVDVSGECWEWKANKNNKGYGMIRLGGLASKVLAHRVSYELEHGVIPGDKIVMHRCDNPGCVNPAHLRLGTMLDNMLDKVAKGRARYNPLRGDNHPFRNGKAPLGEDAGRAQFTNTQVSEFRRLMTAGKSAYQLAKEVGAAYSAMKRIKAGKTYPLAAI